MASILPSVSILESYEIVFAVDVPDRLKCIICRKVLRNAKQTVCGCKACEKCISEYLSNGFKHCPSKQPDCEGYVLMKDSINPDNATNREIGMLKAHCPFKICLFVDSLRELNGHIQSCDYREIICVLCQKSYPFKNKEMHEQQDCDMRNVTCNYCGKVMRYKEMSSQHMDVDSDELCVKYIATCPNLCSVKGEVAVREHLRVCANKRVECPFHSLSCRIHKMPREKLMQHMNEEFLSHTQTLVDEINALKRNLEVSQQELEKQRTVTLELIEFNKKSTDSRMKLEKQVEELKKRGPTAAANIPIVDNSIKTVIFRNAYFIWKITDFESKKNDAETGSRVSVTSDSFYTSEFGYKMCLRIYPAGDGVGRGTHLSVFFAIQKGEYDDLLSWPFKQKVTLSLLDQDGSNKPHSDTFKPDARSACYQKPTDECNIASGSPKFIAFNSLLPTSAYYRNDTIFVKILVDIVGISRP